MDRPHFDPAKVFFAALRGSKKGVLRGPFVDRPHFDLTKVFFVALRGPSWTKKVFSPALRGQTTTKTLQRFSSRPFVALRDQKKGVRGSKKGVPRTFVDRPHFDLANLSSNIRQRDLVDSDPFSELEATPPAVAASPPALARPDPPEFDPPV